MATSFQERLILAEDPTTAANPVGTDGARGSVCHDVAPENEEVPPALNADTLKKYVEPGSKPLAEYSFTFAAVVSRFEYVTPPVEDCTKNPLSFVELSSQSKSNLPLVLSVNLRFEGAAGAFGRVVANSGPANPEVPPVLAAFTRYQ